MLLRDMRAVAQKSLPKETAAACLAQIGVLIADDDRRIALVVRKLLKSLGFSAIHVARDGKQALKLLESERIDMIITDWQMSPMDGISLVKHLRTARNSPNRFLPIIMLTGNAERSHVETARDVGITEFVTKPFSAKTLCDRIMLLIDHPRSFIMSGQFTGPDRRRNKAQAPDGKEKRRGGK